MDPEVPEVAIFTVPIYNTTHHHIPP